jgi:HSP20 family protein
MMSYLTVNPQRVLRPWLFSDDFETAVSKWAGGSESKTAFNPAVDVQETDDAFVVTADIPGLKKEDIVIEILEDTVSIQGTRKNESEEKKDNYHRIERSYGSFKRSFQVPGGFAHDNVKATFTDGVLTLNLPKVEEQKPKQIEVSGN